MWLNRAAFGSRDEILKYFNRHMEVRSPGFVKGRVRVKKASRIKRESIVGSVRAARHTGWAEQEGLAEDKRDKTLTLESRGGRKNKRVSPSLRMKKGKSRPRPTDYPGRTKRQRANAMLQDLGRKRNKRPFIIFGHRKLPAGLWRFGEGVPGKRKLIPIQLFGDKPAKTRKSPWMRSSTKNYFANLNRRAAWEGIVKRLRANKK
jgi:hypothetical protein